MLHHWECIGCLHFCIYRSNFTLPLVCQFSSLMPCISLPLTLPFFPGLSKPRQNSVTNRGPLPSPRLISTNMHNDVSAPHVRYTLMVMQWGQFIDHDIIFTPVNKGKVQLILMPQCSYTNDIHYILYYIWYS